MFESWRFMSVPDGDARVARKSSVQAAVWASLAAFITGDRRTQLPSSRMRLIARVSLFDLAWAGIAPVLAFIVRDGTINRADNVVIYAGVALAVAIVVFQWLRISTPIADFFSIHDAITVWRSCLVTVALTAAVLFTFTRLDSAPRSIPVLHFLLLGCGLTVARATRLLGNMAHARRHQQHGEKLEYILVVGATRLAWFFSKMVEELYFHERRIVAIVDGRQGLINRTLNGYSIVGSPADLSRIVEEYATHGVEIGKIVVAANPDELTANARSRIAIACDAKNIPVEWLHTTLSVATDDTAVEWPHADPGASLVTARPYWRTKRALDVLIALTMIIVSLPLSLIVAGLVLLDVGFPVVFWQQRMGLHGRPIRVYKFRTMKGFYDRQGRRIADSERLSFLGRFLRRNHLDEIPQLLNILEGSMSVVGPRPLLPVDQPANLRYRLLVRSGLTGLAQISGGTQLSAEEKDALDDWYVQHASLLLDLKIIVRTLWVIMRGNPRDDVQIAAALAERRMDAAAPRNEMELSARS